MASGGVSSSSSKVQATPQQIVDLYNKVLPQMLGTTSRTAGSTLGSLAQGATGASNIYSQADLDQLNKLAPGFAQAGDTLQKGQAQTTADILGGAGKDITRTGNDLMRMVDPEFFSVREKIGDNTGKYLDSFNGGNLTGGDMAEAERIINQGNTLTGNLGNTSATSTLANALNFGQYGRQKREAFGNAITQSAGILPSLQNTKFNPVATTIGASSPSNNFGLSMFNPTQGNATSQTPFQFGTSVLSDLAGLGGASNSKSSSVNASVGNCCFIFLESYHGMMPSYVRECRDRYYKSFPKVASGYRKMAKYLVPLMQRSSAIRNFVWHTMVKPLTLYGAHVKRINNEGKRYRIVRKFWFSVWSIIG